MTGKGQALLRRGSASLALLLCLLWAMSTWGQESDSPQVAETQESSSQQSSSTAKPEPQNQPQSQPAAPPAQDGVESNGYLIKMSLEFGGNIESHGGSDALWSTYVNRFSGPRLMEQSLDMHSINHDGVLFDDLSMYSYGYGGDPNNLTRLNISKGRWYDFSANFRRDLNYFDYDLLANPLNPANSNPSVPVPNSPHLLSLVRRNTDLHLTLLPLSAVSFRLGYVHDVYEGEGLTSLHEGTDGSLIAPERDTTDSYQLGVSFKVMPRTVINYDQFFTHFKGETTWSLNGVPFLLPNGTPTNLGIPFNTPASQPCAAPFTPTGTVAVKCNQFTAYSKFSPYTSFYPTEQFSFQSNFLRRLDLSGRFTYSSADTDMPVYQEEFKGFSSRGTTQSQGIGGSGKSKRVVAGSEFGVTIHITDKLRLVDSFHWSNFRIPSDAVFDTTTLAAPTAIAPPNKTTVSSSAFLNALKDDTKLNTFEVDYDFTRRFGGHIGYRYGHRNIFGANSDTTTGVTPPAPPSVDADSSETEINENSGLLGLWARPTDNWRLNFDTEIYTADNVFTRIMPRNMQLYRFRTDYKPVSWVDLGGSVYIVEKRNTESDIDNHQHNRNYAFSAVFTPSERWDLEVNYNYADIFSSTLICFVATPAPEFSPSCASAYLSAVSFYKDRENYGGFNFGFKPVNRVTANVGYTITSTAGSTLILNPLSPSGPLSFNYHLPTASLAIDLARHWTFKSGWNYYGYNEKSDPGPTLPRDFHGNVFTLSMKYHL